MAMVGSKQSERKRRDAFKRRLEVGKHLMLLGNLAAGALIFGQAFSGFSFNLRAAVLGVIVLTLSYVGAWFFMRGGDR